MPTTTTPLRTATRNAASTGNAAASLNATLRSRATTHNKSLGRKGEALAAQYLESQGLTILDTNYTCRHGELDLVATDGQTLIVCEVKTRSDPSFEPPAAALTPRQARRIRESTESWLTLHHVPWVPIRCDLVAILWPPGDPPTLDHRRVIL